MLVALPPLAYGSKAVCPRCKTTLSTRWDEPRKRPIGYALSALFMLVLANIFPFINMRVAGLGNEILISESAWEEMTCLFAPSLAVKGNQINLKKAVKKR